jgi:arylsulfatase A-like enzyme
MADDLGYGDLGCYGQKRIKTPNIDWLAREGMRFTDHYAGSTVCAPSRCSMMTGLHTGHARVRGNYKTPPMGQYPLREDDLTVAQLLKQAGYTTGLIGKWGLGGPGSSGVPAKKGFDYFYGYLCQTHAHNYYPDFLYKNGQRIPVEGNVMTKPRRPDGAGVAAEKKHYSHDLFCEDALSFIETHKAEPFFLFLALTIPHANNQAGDKGMEVPDLGIYKDMDWPEPQKGHAAMISRMDRDVGRIMDKLKALGIDDNTLVMFTSDNGPHHEGGTDPGFNDSNGPLSGIKRDLYEGGIRVPMIARWPGKISSGTTSAHVSAFWDYLPTFSELAGVPVPGAVDGISLAPALLGKTQKEHDYLYWEFHEGRTSAQAVRQGKWKAVRKGPKAATELYDLAADIGETSNVADANRDVVTEVDRIFTKARTEHEIWSLKE